MQVSQPQAFSGVVLYTKTEKNHVFTPRSKGLKIGKKNHYKPRNDNHCMGVLDSPNEAPGRTDYNTKNLNSLRCKKIKKNPLRP